MSDNPNNSNNEPNDEKKEDVVVIANRQIKQDAYIAFHDSEKFLADAEKIFGYLDQIYRRKPDVFRKTGYKIYPDFYPLFQPGKIVHSDIESAEIIRQAVAKIVSKYGNDETAKIQKNKLYDTKISGLLYADIQYHDNVFKIYNKAAFDELVKKDTFSTLEFSYGNIYFSVSSPRSYRERLLTRKVGRIVVHLSLLPKEFWQSDMASELVGSLMSIPSILAIKIRKTDIFDRGDSILLYTAIAPEEAWHDVRHIITKIIPEDCRSEYRIPFSTPLDLGINANIEISYFDPNDSAKVVNESFTDGIGVLGRQAYLMLLDNDISKLGSQIQIFSGFLGGLFEFNNLKITKEGVLSQPVLPVTICPE